MELANPRLLCEMLKDREIVAGIDMHLQLVADLDRLAQPGQEVTQCQVGTLLLGVQQTLLLQLVEQFPLVHDLSR